jgi:lipopolysaccharide export LptBFGC system permease protein LptF
MVLGAIPQISFLLPVISILAVTLAFVRLNSEHELLAMISLRYGLNRMVLPLGFFAMIICILTLASTMFVEPWGRYKFKEFLFNKAQNHIDLIIKTQIKNDTFTTNFFNYVLYAEKISSDKKNIKNIVFTPKHETVENHFVITAPIAKFSGSFKDKNLNITFENGSLYSRSETETFSEFKSIKFNISKIFANQMNEIFKLDDIKSKNIIALSNHLEQIKDQELRQEVQYIYHSRLARPFSSFPFVFLGALFGIQNNRKRGSLAGIIKTISTIFLAYVLIELFRWGGQQQFFSVIFSAWAPYITLCFVSILLYVIRCSTPLWEEKVPIKIALKNLCSKYKS